MCAISPGHLLSVGPFAATSSLVVIITTLVGKADVVERGRGRKREGRSERGEGEREGGGKGYECGPFTHLHCILSVFAYPFSFASMVYLKLVY